MEAQINEIMRSLGRIEQKSDSAILALGEIKDTMKDQDERISTLELDRANQKGMVKVINVVWSAISAAAVTMIINFLKK
jgi:hypothetical protein